MGNFYPACISLEEGSVSQRHNLDDTVEQESDMVHTHLKTNTEICTDVTQANVDIESVTLTAPHIMSKLEHETSKWYDGDESRCRDISTAHSEWVNQVPEQRGGVNFSLATASSNEKTPMLFTVPHSVYTKANSNSITPSLHNHSTGEDLTKRITERPISSSVAMLTARHPSMPSRACATNCPSIEGLLTVDGATLVFSGQNDLSSRNKGPTDLIAKFTKEEECIEGAPDLTTKFTTEGDCFEGAVSIESFTVVSQKGNDNNSFSSSVACKPFNQIQICSNKYYGELDMSFLSKVQMDNRLVATNEYRKSVRELQVSKGRQQVCPIIRSPSEKLPCQNCCLVSQSHSPSGWVDSPEVARLDDDNDDDNFHTRHLKIWSNIEEQGGGIYECEDPLISLETGVLDKPYCLLLDY